MSDQDDKYRRYAEAAQVQAEKAISVRDKESWLKIARSWLELLPKRLRTAEDQFNDKVRDLGTGQEDPVHGIDHKNPTFTTRHFRNKLQPSEPWNFSR